jgi:hypothetical protein
LKSFFPLTNGPTRSVHRCQFVESVELEPLSDLAERREALDRVGRPAGGLERGEEDRDQEGDDPDDDE